MGKVIQNTEEFTNDSITLLVCLDDAMAAKGTMYSDGGDGFEYQDGQYAIDAFTAEKSGDNSVKITCTQMEGKLSDADRYYRVGLVTESGIQYSDWENDGEIEMPLVH